MQMRALLIVAFTASALPGQSPLPTRKIVEDLRIEATSADIPNFGSLRVGPHGEIVVPVYADQRLHFFSASGQWMGAFGRKGSGPGEFQGANRFGWTADTMWAYDPWQKRVTFISPSMKLVRTQTLPPNLNPRDARIEPGVEGIGIFSPQAISGGKYIGTAVLYTGAQKTSERIYAVTPTGTQGVFVADVPSTIGPTVEYRAPNGTWSSAVVPLSFRPQVEFSFDGSRLATLINAWTATGGAYTVTSLSTRGDTLFRKTFPFVGEKIPPRVVDSALRAMNINNGRPIRPPADAAKIEELAKPHVPKFHSPFTSLVLGIDGSTWLQTRAKPERTLVALDRRGTPLFAITLPPRTRLWQASLTTLWTIQRDDDDLGTVVRYRIK